MGKCYPTETGRYNRNHRKKIVQLYIHPRFTVNHRRNAIAWVLHQHLNVQLNYMVNTFDEILELRQGNTTVGIIAVNFSKFETYVDIYAPGCQFTRTVLRDIFTHLFKKSSRLTAIVSSENTKCRDFMRRLGFIQEGIKRQAFDGVADEIHFGMLITDCKWL